MATVYIRGRRDAFLTGRRTTFDPSQGLVTTEDWAAPGDNLNGKAREFITDRRKFDHTISNVISRIIVSASSSRESGYAAQTTDTWQLLANEVQQPIETHPAVLAMVQDDNQSLLRVLAAVRDYQDGVDRPDYEDYFDLGDTGTDARLFRLMVHGGTSYSTTQYALRHTTNVSNAYDQNVADSNVLSVYGVDSLITEAANANYWSFPMPGRLQAKINAIPAPVLNSDYAWGWLKKASTETTAANNRVDITTEYWLGGWSKLLYPEV